MKKKIISASILSADFANLGQNVQKVLNFGVDWIHFDVMDHHYVDNLTIGSMVCESLVNYGISAPIDVHLMVQKINPLIEGFAKAGAHLISFHPQSSESEVQGSISLIKHYKKKVGLAINPDQEIDIVLPWLDQIDLVLIMSVFPGFASQKFIPSSLDKLKQLRKHINNYLEREIYLSIDGGVNLETIYDCSKAGANTFVSGSAIFKSNDCRETIRQMRKQIS